jgi:hypothetical protein
MVNLRSAVDEVAPDAEQGQAGRAAEGAGDVVAGVVVVTVGSGCVGVDSDVDGEGGG